LETIIGNGFATIFGNSIFAENYLKLLKRNLEISWDSHKLPNCILLGGNGSTNYSFASGASELLHKKATFIKRLTLSLFHKGLVLFYTRREIKEFQFIRSRSATRYCQLHGHLDHNASYNAGS